MKSDASPRGLPWQPLTFGGVASFARAPVARLSLVALIAAGLVAGSVVCFFYLAWEPLLRQAISRLPEEGQIHRGRLEWSGPSPVRLAEGYFLSIVVDLANTGELGHAADLQCELGRTEFRLRSLLGYVVIPYPSASILALNRRELEPWWGAWHGMVAAGLGAAVAVGLFACWGVLAAFYALPAQLIAYYADRSLSAFGAWRLAVASLLPGGVLMAAAILAYSFHQLNLIQLLFALPVHLVLGWIYLFVSPFRLTREPNLPAKRRNPFR